MTNNDIIRRIRYIFDFEDAQMIGLFASAEHEVTRAQVSDWLKKNSDPEFRAISDRELAIFLNGLINEKRGKREGPQPAPENELTNNMILRKIKIALNLRNEDMLELMEMAGLKISKHELSAFFRKPGQSQYRDCKNQVLRNLLSGLQMKHRPNK